MADNKKVIVDIFDFRCPFLETMSGRSKAYLACVFLPILFELDPDWIVLRVELS